MIYDSELEEQGAPEAVVVPRFRSRFSMEERDSLQSIDRRLNWYERTDA